RPRHVDVRLVAATNRDLGEAMRRGEVLPGLYYPINTITLPLPPLRERRGDGGLLARAILGSHGTHCPERLGAAALAALQGYAWPGNVREVPHAMERGVILSKGEEIQPEDLPPEVAGIAPLRSTTPGGSLEAMERQHIVGTLREVGGHRGKAAALLAIDPKTL